MTKKPNAGRTQGRRGNWALGGEIAPERIAWANVFAGTFAVSQYSEEEEGLPEGITEADLGESVSLTLASYFERRSVRFILTHFTEEELNVFERITKLAIDKARPTVVKRDQIAREAMARGDDSHQRVYRSVPQLVERKRKG